VKRLRISGNDDPFSASKVGVALCCRKASENVYAGIFCMWSRALCFAAGTILTATLEW
jgi:hypothetical protein